MKTVGQQKKMPLTRIREEEKQCHIDLELSVGFRSSFYFKSVFSFQLTERFSISEQFQLTERISLSEPFQLTEKFTLSEQFQLAECLLKPP